MTDGSLAATPAAEQLSREAIAQVDSSDQLGDMLALPEHLRDALWRVESADMQPRDTPAGLVVAGMGGSAIGGALARAALGDQASRPIFVTRAYGLPTWTTPDTMVLCASYSGDTEETLACYESAGALGAARMVATTGGRLAEMARADGVPRDPAARRLSAARRGRLHDGRGARGGRAVRRRAAADRGDRRRRVAYRAARRGVGPRRRPRTRSRRRSRAGCTAPTPVIAGAGLTAPIAYRWKTQINENAKRPRSRTNCPSSTTTRSSAGRARPEVGRFSAVFLDDSDAHPRVKERIDADRAADRAATPPRASAWRRAGRRRSSA